MPKISVLVPVYCVEKYIEKCVRSLFEQTLDDLEFIFVDDCTPDKSMEVLNRVLGDYPQRKSQVIILQNERNLGQSGTRKRAIAAATGDYVIHCDSDDWAESNWLELMYNEAISKNAEMVQCDAFMNYEDGREIRKYMKCSEDKTQTFIYYYTSDRMASLWSHLVARKIVQDKNIFWPTWNYTEDTTLVFQYTMMANRIAVVNAPLYHYRDNAQSISHEKFEVLYKDFLQSHTMMEKWCKELGIWEKMLPQRLARGFNRKSRMLGEEKGSDSKAQEVWLKTNPELGFLDLLRADLPLPTKIYSVILLLRLFPFVNKVVDIRRRIWS
jgi:glycosyltransferase involved in cell wall biosynthesis